MGAATPAAKIAASRDPSISRTAGSSSSRSAATAEAVTNGLVTSPLFRLSYDTDNVRGRPAADGYLWAVRNLRPCTGCLPTCWPQAGNPTLPRGRAGGVRTLCCLPCMPAGVEGRRCSQGRPEQRGFPSCRAGRPDTPQPGMHAAAHIPPPALRVTTRLRLSVVQEHPDLTRTWKKTMKIAVTGAAGQISNHLVRGGGRAGSSGHGSAGVGAHTHKLTGGAHTKPTDSHVVQH